MYNSFLNVRENSCFSKLLIAINMAQKYISCLHKVTFIGLVICPLSFFKINGSVGYSLNSCYSILSCGISLLDVGAITHFKAKVTKLNICPRRVNLYRRLIVFHDLTGTVNNTLVALNFRDDFFLHGQWWEGKLKIRKSSQICTRHPRSNISVHCIRNRFFTSQYESKVFPQNQIIWPYWYQFCTTTPRERWQSNFV